MDRVQDSVRCRGFPAVPDWGRHGGRSDFAGGPPEAQPGCRIARASKIFHRSLVAERDWAGRRSQRDDGARCNCRQYVASPGAQSAAERYFVECLRRYPAGRSDSAKHGAPRSFGELDCFQLGFIDDTAAAGDWPAARIFEAAAADSVEGMKNG